MATICGAKWIICGTTHRSAGFFLFIVFFLGGRAFLEVGKFLKVNRPPPPKPLFPHPVPPTPHFLPPPLRSQCLSARILKKQLHKFEHEQLAYSDLMRYTELTELKHVRALTKPNSSPIYLMFYIQDRFPFLSTLLYRGSFHELRFEGQVSLSLSLTHTLYFDADARHCFIEGPFMSCGLRGRSLSLSRSHTHCLSMLTLDTALSRVLS